MDPSISSDDEVFFGPILAKEAKKASKLRRATQVFMPSFRKDLNASSSSSSQCEQEGEDSLSDEVFDDVMSETDVIDRDCFENLTTNQTENDTDAASVTEPSQGNIQTPQKVLKKLKGDSPTKDSPLPKILELTKNENDSNEKKESPFQKKSKALMDLIHKTREEWSSPTRSPSSVSISESETRSPFKRKHISTPLANHASPLLYKVPKVSSKVDGILHKGDEDVKNGNILTEEKERDTQCKVQNQAEVTDINDSHCEERNSNVVEKLSEGTPNEECSINLSFTEVQNSISDNEQVESEDVKEIECESEEQNLKPCQTKETLSGIEINDETKCDACLQDCSGLCKDEQSSSEHKVDTLQPSKLSVFAQVKAGSNAGKLNNCDQSHTNVPSLIGYTPRNTEESANQSSPLSKDLNIHNKENSVIIFQQPEFQKIASDEIIDAVSCKDEDALVDTATEVRDFGLNIQARGMSSSSPALCECSNLLSGGRQLTASPCYSPITLRDNSRVMSQHTSENMNVHNRSPVDSNCSLGTDAIGTSPQMCNFTNGEVDSPMSLRRKLLEQKKAQLMRLKQAKDEMKHRLLQEDKRQFNQRVENALALQSNVADLEALRPAAATINRIEASPTETLDDNSFDELTRFYTWKNAQLLTEESYTCSSPESLPNVNQDRPHLRWTNNLITEVTEFSSPSRPTVRGRSILSKKM
ncbi:uncharacterized protein [Apostichopus japonicus]|uniref:uncharacterized protein n=1 Tax=Stichopus japonicus TaxID=307972 RepID=UPI003AB5CD80